MMDFEFLLVAIG